MSWGLRGENMFAKKTDPLWGSQQVGTDSPRIHWGRVGSSSKLILSNGQNIIARVC